jgi:hypothetical protein
MAHKQHEEFNEGVFTRLCDEALRDLPGDSRSEEAALDYLLHKVRNFCGVESVKIRDYTGIPRAVQLKQQIVDVVEHDSIVEHPTSSFFKKEPIIDEYVRKVTG